MFHCAVCHIEFTDKIQAIEHEQECLQLHQEIKSHSLPASPTPRTPTLDEYNHQGDEEFYGFQEEY